MSTNLPAVQEPKEVTHLRGYLEQQIGRIAQNIRGELEPHEIVNVTCELARADSKLRRCEPDTVLIALLQACQLGLTLQKNLGHACLIPRKNGFLSKQAGRDVIEATFFIGYKGLIHMVRQGNPNIHTIKSVIVYREEIEAGRFDMTAGSDPRIVHQPLLQKPPLESYAGVYSIVEFKDGAKADFEWMPREDVEKARAVSAALEEGPWKTWPEEMIKKTVIRRHSKRLELKPEVAARIRDNEVLEMQYSDSSGSYEKPAMEMPRRKLEATAQPAAVPMPAPEPAAKTPQGPTCKKCGSPTRFIKAGKKKDGSGNYPAFWACIRKDCKGGNWTDKEWQEKQTNLPVSLPVPQPAPAASGTTSAEEAGVSVSAFKTAIVGFLNQDATLALAVMKDNGCESVDAVPETGYGRVNLLDLLHQAFKAKKG